MVADDSASQRLVVTIAPKDADYDVGDVSDDQDALTKFGGRKIHLIVSKARMPIMDGMLTFVKGVKADANHKLAPFVLLTTGNHDARMMEGDAAGAKAWIVKPFRPPELPDAVSRPALH